MIQIRTYQEKDRERVEQICTATASKEFKENPLMHEALLDVFCHYYIEKEPENCLIAADEDDRPAGYILCAENFDIWEKIFTEKYLLPSANPATQMMGPGTIEGLRKYAGTYPAHLHIDLDPAYQRQGVGTKLMDALTAHLKEKEIAGLCLCVGRENENGLNFYLKYGFQKLEENEQEIVMGLSL